MKKQLITLIMAAASLLFITPAISGSGHSHDGSHSHGPVSGEDATKMAATRLNNLVKAGKIPGSWSGLNAISTVKKEYSNGPEWVITFKNTKVNDVKKQTLYMFFTLDGQYIAANFTGN